MRNAKTNTMETLENYKKASLETLIPTTIRLKNNTTEIVMIPKKELWYESSVFSGHKSSCFRLDKLQTALDSRCLNYKTAFYSFI
jgi:hypothetical protein